MMNWKQELKSWDWVAIGTLAFAWMIVFYEVLK
jgi:hypothetical protein